MTRTLKHDNWGHWGHTSYYQLESTDFSMNASLRDVTFGQPSQLEMNQEGGFGGIFSRISQPEEHSQSGNIGCLRLGYWWSKFLKRQGSHCRWTPPPVTRLLLGIYFFSPALEVGGGAKETGRRGKVDMDFLVPTASGNRQLEHSQHSYVFSFVQVTALGLWWSKLQLLCWGLHQPATVDHGGRQN